MKNFIGIDFAKEKFDVALITSEFTANHQVEHGVFDNNKDGFRDFLKWVKGKYPKAKTDDLLFCGENTGVYSRDLSEFLVRKGYPMYLENAYRIKQSSGLTRGRMRSLRICNPADILKPLRRHIQLILPFPEMLQCHLHIRSADKHTLLALAPFCDIKAQD